MKKAITLLLAAVMALSLAACGGNKTVKLTTENIEEYLTISKTVVSSDVATTNNSIAGISFKSYSGESEIKIETVKQSDVNFENVTLTCELRAVTSPQSGWEFVSGNKPDADTWEKTGGATAHSKTITITVPFDGNTSTTEKLELAIYAELKDVIVAPSKLSSFTVTVTDVTGNAILN